MDQIKARIAGSKEEVSLYSYAQLRVGKMVKKENEFREEETEKGLTTVVSIREKSS